MKLRILPSFLLFLSAYSPLSIIFLIQNFLWFPSSSFLLCTVSCSPFPTNLDQSRLFQIIPCAGVTPVLRSIDIASRYWIMMDVIELLTHHRLAYDGLRVIAFFPNLIGGFGFEGA
uniref:Uncharacterized protein n=1 Tax=Candidatus Kentrum sp. MB TaxID=2138164 RepID=A0A450XKI7_9GAMM|nr:MAG: hypothetical protein BECKMB1821G_GA0114241_101131 [Candidatus Kentron sp. MB]VFK29840.1 MAG: hypothetical protein BECKMB1821I_GA0114274_101221 [Candidatus Kentron sp. MB]VFK74963.1 MAG: hypothetical protein BECKMB1821H_GA0114242_101321 [Candidatus Kentron sp. MB]